MAVMEGLGPYTLWFTAVMSVPALNILLLLVILAVLGPAESHIDRNLEEPCEKCCSGCCGSFLPVVAGHGWLGLYMSQLWQR